MIKNFKKNLQNLFKYISYNIFFIIYGRIKGTSLIKDSVSHRVDSVKFENNISYKVYSINSGRLYTDRINNTALIYENILLDGPSFQLKNNNNSDIMSNFVILNGTPRIKKKLSGKVMSLLTGGGGNSNYWHWLFDVLPRLAIVKKIISLDKIDYFLFPDTIKLFQRETLNILNVPINKRLSSVKFRHISSSEIIVTEHPFIKKKAHDDTQNVPIWISEWLKENFIKKNLFTNKIFPKKIYIDRGDSVSNHSKYQNILNKDEFYKFLRKEGFEFLKLNKIRFIDQVKIFNSAEIILGIHGAGFSNIVFCQKNTKVVEIRSTHTGKMYENLAINNKLNYDKIIYQPTNLYKDTVTLGDFKVPIDLLKKKIEI